MTDTFHFKQFSVDQTNCAMKVNTDGVLLAALNNCNKEPISILDIGTGTGLIALMLAQKYSGSLIHAVEIDEHAAKTAKSNFEKSQYSERITGFHLPIKEYLEKSNDKYDLIISNPPFFINSLTSKSPKKELARHTNISFFEHLIPESAKKLNPSGSICFILPIQTANLVKKICSTLSFLFVSQEIRIHSFPQSQPHRSILFLSFEDIVPVIKDFVIYDKASVYTVEYKSLLKDYLTIF